MKIIDYNIEELIPYEFNNRRHDEVQIDRIARSIKEFGFNQPIVVDENDIILVGHGRLLAAQKLELAKVPVVQVKGLKEEEKKAYRILDNKLQNDSQWDWDNLNLELGNLVDLNFDCAYWGLDSLHIEAMEDKQAGEEKEEDEEAKIIECPKCGQSFIP